MAIGLKLFFPFLLLILFIISSISWFYYGSLKETLFSEHNNNVNNTKNSVISIAQGYIANYDVSLLDEMETNLIGQSGVIYGRFLNEKKELYFNKRQAEALSEKKRVEKISDIQLGKIYDGDEIIGYLEVAFNKKILETKLIRAFNDFLFILGLVFVVLIVSFFLH